MIVAVTGSNGFIGRHLCAALQGAGHDLRPIVRADFASGRFSELIAGAEVVIHAAAATRAPTESDFHRANVGLTGRVLDAARAANIRRFVFISSQAAAGPARSLDAPVREDDPPSPIENYGRSKLAAERLVSASGLEFTIVRPASVYGPDDQDFATAFALARRGVAIHPGNRLQWISIIHVDDCVRGIIAASESPRAGGRVYFLANDRPIQWRDVYRNAAPKQQLRLDFEVPLPLVQGAAIAGDAMARLTGRTPLLSSQKLELAQPPFWICSSERAARELSLRATIPVEEGIARAARAQLG